MNRSLRLWPLWLLVAFTPLVRADDTNSAAKKPAASAPAAPAKPAASTTAAADDELLEFLGSVGDDADGEWMDYLSKTEMPKKATPKTPAAAETSNTSSK